MSFSKVALILFFYTGVLQSVFFAIYLFITKTGNLKANRWLGLLLLALVMRLGKSAYIITTQHRPDFLINIGLAGYLIIGAFMLWYFQALTNPNFQVRKIDFLHLVPFITVITCCTIIPYPPNYDNLTKIKVLLWYKGFYRGLHFYLGVYLVINLFWLIRYYQRKHKNIKNPSALERSKLVWMSSIWTSVTFTWAFYVISHFGAIPYQTALIIYTSLVFLLGLLALTRAQVFTQTFHSPKYKTSPLTNDQTDRHIAEIKNLMEQEKAFKDVALSLPKLAEMLAMPTYQLSQIINENLANNFADFVSQYRVNEAKQLLADPKYDHYKIAGIAFESGFNNLSSFNAAFKKRVQLTPSQYRKQHSMV